MFPSRLTMLRFMAIMPAAKLREQKFLRISLMAQSHSLPLIRAASEHMVIRLQICREVYLWTMTDIPIMALVTTDMLPAMIRLRRAASVNIRILTAISRKVILIFHSRLRKASAMNMHSLRLLLPHQHHSMTNGLITFSE